MNQSDISVSSPRGRVLQLVQANEFQRAVIALIVLNALVLGLETSTGVMAVAGPLLRGIDQVVLLLFVLELLLRLFAFGGRFFRDPWSLFDLLVVGIALVPSAGPFAVLRALRVLRVLRLISTVPRMRGVVEALLGALPGLGAVVALLSLIFYVAAVIATHLFGERFPDWFGSLGSSLYTLFQVMTLESWSMGIVRPVMEVYPQAWMFFLPFILTATFTMLNLFIAVVVNAMQARAQAHIMESEAVAHDERAQLLAEVRALRVEVKALSQKLGGD